MGGGIAPGKMVEVGQCVVEADDIGVLGLQVEQGGINALGARWEAVAAFDELD